MVLLPERGISPRYGKPRERRIRNITLHAPYNDKAINALVSDYDAFFRQRADEAMKHGEYHVSVMFGLEVSLCSFEPTEQDIGRICGKYVKVLVVDSAGRERLLEK
jgi:hypothetical protein